MILKASAPISPSCHTSTQHAWLQTATCAQQPILDLAISPQLPRRVKLPAPADCGLRHGTPASLLRGQTGLAFSLITTDHGDARQQTKIPVLMPTIGTSHTSTLCRLLPLPNSLLRVLVWRQDAALSLQKLSLFHSLSSVTNCAAEAHRSTQRPWPTVTHASTWDRAMYLLMEHHVCLVKQARSQMQRELCVWNARLGRTVTLDSNARYVHLDGSQIPGLPPRLASYAQ